MTIRFDEKGKIYTNVITKDSVSATVQTITHRIHGELHVRQGERLKDEMDSAKKFLPITNGKVYDLAGEFLFETQFILVNREHVIWITPDEEVIEESEESGEAQ